LNKDPITKRFTHTSIGEFVNKDPITKGSTHTSVIESMQQGSVSYASGCRVQGVG